MQYSIFENIEHHKDYPAKISVVSTDHSDLHRALWLGISCGLKRFTYIELRIAAVCIQ